jgi:predicted ATP-binding protein involved in virulence
LASDRFFVKNLTLEDFRCFEKVELGPFDPHFNLLVGTNGAGKSSVLLALANLFRPVATPEGDGLRDKMVSSSDVRFENRIGADGVRFRKLHLPGLLRASFAQGDLDLTASEHVSASHKPRSLYLPEIWRSEDAPQRIWRLGQDASGRLRESALPLLVLFTSKRSFQSSVSEDSAVSSFPGERGLAFANWRDAGTNAFALREWIKDQTLVALQRDALERTAGQERSASSALRQLRLVQRAIADAVEGATDIEFDADRKDVLVYFSDGRALDFSSMSDGQRALIGMVADIARRACLLNAPFLGAETLSKTPGLVLIDELDLHLHPRWQRRVIGDLKRIFPNIQFFATTHSPQVIGEARPEEIVLLTPMGQKRPMQSFGMDSNWVLECVMEAEGRDPRVALEIKLLFDEIEDGKFDEARARIARLRNDIGDMPDLVGAESYIWRVEHDGEEAAE